MAEEKDLEDNQTKNQLEKEFEETVPGGDSQTTEEEGSKETEEEESESSESSKESEETSEEGEQEEVESPERSEKFIPIPKWQEAKKEWRNKEEEYEEKIKELEEKVGSGEQEVPEEDLEEFAKEYEMDKEAVEKLIGLAAQKAQIPSDLKEDIEKVKKAEADKEDQQQFNEEFEGEVLPQIKKEFPDASQERIDKVRENLDALAHTQRLHQTPLEFIFARNRDKYGEILNPPNQKTAESGSMGRKGEQMTYGDVMNLPPKERNEAIEGMNEKEYEEFMKAYAKEKGTGRTIHSQGKEIEQV